MNNNHREKIINISSVIGKRAFPFVALYTSSKFSLEGYSDALRRELLLFGIDVILIEPGPIKTAIWDKASSKENNPFNKSDYNSILKQFYKIPIKRGKEVYTDMCVTCHLPNGEGVPKVYPPLAKSDYLMEKREASIRAIKYGIRGKIVVNDVQYRGIMANLGLYEDEVADVMNYITNSWGNENLKMITEEEVKKISKK